MPTPIVVKKNRLYRLILNIQKIPPPIVAIAAGLIPMFMFLASWWIVSHAPENSLTLALMCLCPVAATMITTFGILFKDAGPVILEWLRHLTWRYGKPKNGLPRGRR